MSSGKVRPGHVLITGANGFLGTRLTERALAGGLHVTVAVRAGRSIAPQPRLRIETIEDVSAAQHWDQVLAGVDAVIHTAGRAHVMKDSAANPLAEFRRVNSYGTKHLAEAAARNGVRRMVFVSSIKVNGERTLEAPYRETDPVQPVDPYGISKWEGEQALREVGARTGLETVVVRAPLVYGPGVRANFLSLLRWVDRRLPLPFASIDNHRSLVGVANLADLLLRCATVEAASGQLYLAADAEQAPSIGALIRAIARALDKPANLLPVPRVVLESLGRLLRQREQVRRLCESLQVDNGKARQQLGWIPPLSFEAGLRETVDWYRRTRLHPRSHPENRM